MSFSHKYNKYKKKYLDLKNKKQYGGDPEDQTRITEDLNSIQTNNNGEFYLFAYGSNGMTQLSERLGVSYENIKKMSYPALLRGWKRGFFSYSDKWKGSVATIYQDPHLQNSIVGGVSLKMVKNRNNFYVNGQSANMNELCKNEAVQYNKYRIKSLTRHSIMRLGRENWEEINPAYAFVGNQGVYHTSSFPELQGTQPSRSYLNAIAKMIRDRRELHRYFANKDKIDIDIKIYKDGRWSDGRPKKVWYSKNAEHERDEY